MSAVLRELYGIVRPSGRRALAAVLAISVFQAVMQTVAVFSLIPLLTAASDMAAFRRSKLGGVFVEALGGGSDHRLLVLAGSIALANLVFGNLVAVYAEYVRNRYAYAVAHQLRMRLLGGMLDRRYEFFAHANTAVLLKTLVDDVWNVAYQLILPALDLVARVLLVVLLVAAALLVAPWVVLGGAVVVALYYLLVMRPIRARGGRWSDLVKDDLRGVYFEIGQLLTGAKPIIAADRKAYFLARAERVSGVYAQRIPKGPMFVVIPRTGLEIVVFGGMIAWLLVVLVSGGNLVELVPRIGLIAVVAYRLMPSLQSVFAHIAAMTTGRHLLEEVGDLLREQDSLRAASPRGSSVAELAEPLHWDREIRFENVSFTYAGADEPAIDRISFTIPKGHRVAFVGPTGSGKSTLIDLVLGLLQPTGGRILVDGAPLGAEALPGWRRAVGYVPQDLFLLDGTIAENIAFGFDQGRLDRRRVRDVAELAQATEFIEDGRSHGFDAGVGERGARLSGGQRQRLALARALYGRPNILVMDEATSALDPQTEQKVVVALAEAHEALTIVTVTHRLSTVRDYDCIHYVQGGRIVASGDFAGLAASHETFREFAG